MRTPSPKPKREEVVPLPDHLVAFLRDVSERIKANDEATIIESDDLLQAEFAYGGRDSDEGDRYSFTYYPEQGIRPKWQFSLTAAQLEEIAQNDEPSLILWACTSTECRCKFADHEGPQCFYCDWEDPSAAV
jgi:hypothetical protein